jgi:ABC-type transport system substrate-binding protein
MKRVILIAAVLAMLTLTSSSRCNAADFKAEDFAVGAPEFNPNESILDSQDLIPVFIRKAIASSIMRGPLVEVGASDLQQHSQVSDASRVSPDYARWSFRIKSAARFSDRSRVRTEDIIFSLSRCAERGALRPLLSIQDREERGGIAWIDIDFGKQQANAAKKLLADLSNCPIVQRNSSVLFGKDLGVGSNVVSGGPYIISAVVPGRKYILSRVRKSTTDRTGLEQIEVRGFANPEQGLAALRVGTIRAFAVRDDVIIGKARKDETLEQRQCDGYVLLKRRGVVIDCYENVSILSVRGDG